MERFFEDSDSGSDGYNYFAVKVKGKWGYVKVTDSKPLGEMVIKPKYDEAGKFKKGKAQVKKGKDTFFIDVNGNKVK